MGIGRTNVGGGKWWIPEFVTPPIAVTSIPSNQGILWRTITGVDTSKRYLYQVLGQASNSFAAFTFIDLKECLVYSVGTQGSSPYWYIEDVTTKIRNVTPTSFEIQNATNAAYMEILGYLKIKDSKFK